MLVVVRIVLYCLCSGLTDFSEQQTSQEIDLSTRQPSSAKPSTGLYESLDKSRPDAVVYSHISHSSEPAYENSDVRPTVTSNIDYEDVAAVTPVYSN